MHDAQRFNRGVSALTALAALALVTATACDRRPSSPTRTDRTEIPSLDVPTLSGALEIDGRLDEAAWRRAAAIDYLVHPGSGEVVGDSPVNASARLLWDVDALYLAVTVDDAEADSPFDYHDADPHIWAEASGIELMLQPGDPGDNREYCEIQVDVSGAVWDTRFDDYNQPVTDGPEGRRFGHQDWSAQLERAVRHEPGNRYTVEMRLPWDAVSSARTAIPPDEGDVWRANLYAFRDGQSHSLAWSAILGEGNFHRSSRFGRLRFIGLTP